jgi:hypothetical protein
VNFYEYQRPVGKIDDVPELRDEFITIFDGKSGRADVSDGLCRHAYKPNGSGQS